MCLLLCRCHHGDNNKCLNCTPLEVSTNVVCVCMCVCVCVCVCMCVCVCVCVCVCDKALYIHCEP